VQLLSGAIGAIDALAAAASAGWTRWSTPAASRRGLEGTPAEAAFDLDALKEPTVIFEGSAREAARLYPKNANVAPRCRWPAWAWTDPVRCGRSGRERERAPRGGAGAFGGFELTMRGKPLAANPKTSALTVFSVGARLGNRAHALSI
jgi:aspartate dehydrogenase